MIKIYIPQKKHKYNKSNIRGIWQDKNKLYYDNIKIIEYNMPIIGVFYQDIFLKYLNTIKECYNQECIFYTIDDIGYIFYNKNKIDILSNKAHITIDKNKLKITLQAILKLYNGLTIYKNKNNYYIEVFYNIK